MLTINNTEISHLPPTFAIIIHIPRPLRPCIWRPRVPVPHVPASHTWCPQVPRLASLSPKSPHTRPDVPVPLSPSQFYTQPDLYVIFGINTTRDISKLSKFHSPKKLRIEISKYHSWYLRQISLTSCHYLYKLKWNISSHKLLKYLTVRYGGSVTWERALNNYSRTRLGNWNSEGKRKTVRVGGEFEFSV